MNDAAARHVATVLDQMASASSATVVCSTYTSMPPTQAAPPPSTKPAPARHDMSVILVTGSYDHEIRFWEAWSGICSRTIARSGEIGVRPSLL